MPVPKEAPATPHHPPAAHGDLKILVTKVFVRGLKVDVEIGVYEHELNRRQPLVVDVELDVAAGGWRHLADTVNYEHVVAAARQIAASGHIGLVESFAQRLAQACFDEPRVLRARIRVEKPEALAPDAQAAGVEITAVRG
ncbi:MAG TPA: dihydroneopterin aldolase [Caulobacteraceae bacterium]|nr:dihydroneopterin aldolase [Caulobacteraceae bacterium]